MRLSQFTQHRLSPRSRSYPWFLLSALYLGTAPQLAGASSLSQCQQALVQPAQHHQFEASVEEVLKFIVTKNESERSKSKGSLRTPMMRSLLVQTEMEMRKRFGEDGARRLFREVQTRFWAHQHQAPKPTAPVRFRNKNQVFQASMNGKIEAGEKEQLFVALSPDFKTIAQGFENGDVVLWDRQTKIPLLGLERKTEDLRFLKFTPDGRYLITQSLKKYSYVWDPQSGKQLFKLNKHWLERDFSPKQESNIIDGTAISPDSKTLLVYYRDGNIDGWNIETGKRLYRIKGHKNMVSDIHFSPQGDIFASKAYHEKIKVWNTTTGHFLGELGSENDYHLFAFSEDGEELYAGGNEMNTWDPRSGHLISTWAENEGQLQQLQASPDGRHLFLTFDLKAGIWDPKKHTLNYRIPAGSPWLKSFSADGKYFFTLNNETSENKVWDTNSGYYLGLFPQGQKFPTSEISKSEGYPFMTFDRQGIYFWRLLQIIDEPDSLPFEI